jgi:hypothetical protein
MIDGPERLLPQRHALSRNFQNPLDLALFTALAYTLQVLAHGSGHCRGPAFPGGFRQFPGQPVGLFVLYIQAHGAIYL